MKYETEYAKQMRKTDRIAKFLETLTKRGLQGTVFYAKLRLVYHDQVKKEVEILDKYIEENGL